LVDAKLIFSYRTAFADTVFVELVAWEVPTPLRGSRHRYKYRLALVADDVCVLRYDNEAGKGDHKHVGDKEYRYDFIDLDQLRRDFLVEARRWLLENLGDQRDQP